MILESLVGGGGTVDNGDVSTVPESPIIWMLLIGVGNIISLNRKVTIV